MEHPCTHTVATGSESFTAAKHAATVSAPTRYDEPRTRRMAMRRPLARDHMQLRPPGLVSSRCGSKSLRATAPAWLGWITSRAATSALHELAPPPRLAGAVGALVSVEGRRAARATARSGRAAAVALPRLCSIRLRRPRFQVQRKTSLTRCVAPVRLAQVCPVGLLARDRVALSRRQSSCGQSASLSTDTCRRRRAVLAGAGKARICSADD
jgi:hypothetical protein